MEQTVYIDLFFLINFSMDFLGLFLAAKLLERSKRLLRLALAAIFGGIYACVALISPLNACIPTVFFLLLLSVWLCRLFLFLLGRRGVVFFLSLWCLERFLFFSAEL